VGSWSFATRLVCRNGTTAAKKNWKMPMRGNGVAVEPDKKHNNQPQNKKALQRTVIERSTRRVTMAGER